ncbi:hypothetical protein ACFLU6_16205 [Acidobacteriota bacterium]
MDIRCPQCRKRFIIRKPGKYKCNQCDAMLPTITPEDLGIPPEGAETPTPPPVAPPPRRAAH